MDYERLSLESEMDVKRKRDTNTHMTVKVVVDTLGLDVGLALSLFTQDPLVGFLLLLLCASLG